MVFELKKGLLLGAATAATQIEGGVCGHSWNDWYDRGHITDKSNPARSNDHYRRWREDADLMASMGLQTYRFSIEWARICPKEDKVDEEAIAHYREEMAYLRDKGILLLLTLHHFTNPMWFEGKGGFTKTENIRYFIDFVALCIRSFGDLVSEYITINEPNVYAAYSYYFGTWPPGEKSFVRTFKVMSNLALCHIQAYELIHKMRREMGHQDTKVSFAIHLRAFDPKDPENPWHRLATKLVERFFQGAITEAMCYGSFKWPLKAPNPVKKGEYCDFIAVNYYSRTSVSGIRDGTRENCPKNDLGWEIYPQGIIRCTKKMYDLIKRPVYITENGTCDNNDTFRSRYIYDHLMALCLSELPVERYYHWCFCDNFEWLEGESARFGLVHVDYESQKRTVKKSGNFFSEVIRAGGVTKEIYEKYVKNEEYHF
jgi:beta-glucosidase